MPYEITLRVIPELAAFAKELVWNSTQQITRNADGSVDVHFKTTQLPEIKRWVLGQGKTVRVLAPPELIREIKEEISAMGELYKA